MRRLLLQSKVSSSPKIVDFSGEENDGDDRQENHGHPKEGHRRVSSGPLGGSFRRRRGTGANRLTVRPTLQVVGEQVMREIQRRALFGPKPQVLLVGADEEDVDVGRHVDDLRLRDARTGCGIVVDGGVDGAIDGLRVLVDGVLLDGDVDVDRGNEGGERDGAVGDGAADALGGVVVDARGGRGLILRIFYNHLQ